MRIPFFIYTKGDNLEIVKQVQLRNTLNITRTHTNIFKAKYTCVYIYARIAHIYNKYNS